MILSADLPKYKSQYQAQLQKDDSDRAQLKLINISQPQPALKEFFIVLGVRVVYNRSRDQYKLYARSGGSARFKLVEKGFDGSQNYGRYQTSTNPRKRRIGSR